MNYTRNFRRWDLALLAVIIVSALAVRLLGICRGLPYVYYSDESLIVNHAMAFGTGDLNPHSFIYPSLYMYVLFVIYGLSYMAGWVLGMFHSTNDFVRLFFADATLFYLPGRLIAALSGIVSVGVVYLFGRRAYDTRVGLIGAAFLAFAVLHVTFSHFVKTHVPAGMLVIIALYLAWRIYCGKAGWSNYLLAGVVAGLAASTIYHAGFVLVSVVVAHLIRWRELRRDASAISLLSPRLLGAIGICFVTFLIGTPYAMLDWRTFMGDLTSHGAMFLHGGFWEKSYFYPVTSLIGSIGRPVGFLAVIGLVHALFRHRPVDLIVASQPLFLVLFLTIFPIKEPQHMLIAFPAVALLGASFLFDALTWLIRVRRWQTAALAAATIILVAAPAKNSFHVS
jgi:4-amino-4-deoxy-L-arabinose transferase-like glycosyltransferase